MSKSPQLCSKILWKSFPAERINIIVKKEERNLERYAQEAHATIVVSQIQTFGHIVQNYITNNNGKKKKLPEVTQERNFTRSQTQRATTYCGIINVSIQVQRRIKANMFSIVSKSELHCPLHDVSLCLFASKIIYFRTPRLIKQLARALPLDISSCWRRALFYNHELIRGSIYPLKEQSY